MLQAEVCAILGELILGVENLREVFWFLGS